MVSALRKYLDLFAGRWVTIFTDDATLTSWENMKLSSNRLCKWRKDLQEFLLRFEHLPGNENPVADALLQAVNENEKEFTNKGILAAFEQPHAKTNGPANQIIFQEG